MISRHFYDGVNGRSYDPVDHLYVYEAFYDKYWHDKPIPGANIRWGDLRPASKIERDDPDVTILFVPDWFCGDSAAIANRQTIMLDMLDASVSAGKVDWQMVHVICDNGLAFNVSDTDEASADWMMAIWHSLENYPILDESQYYQVEAEKQEAAWENWVASEFAHAIERRLIERGYDVYVETDYDMNAPLRQLFDRLFDRTPSMEWIEESCGEMYVDIGRLLADPSPTLDSELLAVAEEW